MTAGHRHTLLIIVACAGSLALSYFTMDASRLLVATGLALDLQSQEYQVFQLVLTDMLVQTLYFTALTVWTGRRSLLVILALVHVIDVVMFLRLGSPFLWASAVGSPTYFSAKLCGYSTFTSLCTSLW